MTATAAIEAHNSETETSPSAWARRIGQTWSRAVESILATGALLLEAKGNLPHGAFEAMVERELPFSARTAQRLMVVAQSPVLANPTHVSLLPPSWGTLYELTKLPEPALLRALNDGTVTPETERREVVALLEDVRRPPSRPDMEQLETCTVDDLAVARAKKAAWPRPAPRHEVHRGTHRRNQSAELDRALIAMETATRAVLAIEVEAIDSTRITEWVKSLSNVRDDLGQAVRRLRHGLTVPSPRSLRPPSDGMQLVRQALELLGQIRPDDVERRQALTYLTKWLDQQER